MNEDQFEGKWDQIKGKIREHFGRLTDDDVQEVKGRRQHMLAKIQERYGDTKEDAERKLAEWEKKF